MKLIEALYLAVDRCEREDRRPPVAWIIDVGQKTRVLRALPLGAYFVAAGGEETLLGIPVRWVRQSALVSMIPPGEEDSYARVGVAVETVRVVESWYGIEIAP